MKQVIQDFKTGDLYVDDVPIPHVNSGFVLINNHFSLISAGTERSTVSTAKASLVGKAKQRPDLVKQVLDTYKKEGFSETLKRVRTKLATLKELGYSSAGKILMSKDTKGIFKPGDHVACGSGYASHSAIISVPQNLVVKVPESVPLEHAAFTTLGSIAMQGVRQANPKIGDFVCVIGLGLLGQLTAQILKANGCQVFGIDTSEQMVKLGTELSCHHATPRSNPKLDSELEFFTDGHGFDSVIITAATKSNDPVELATSILRQKGVIVIVGAVPMNIDREPFFYKKELELKISCSYGPGRYDYTYEEGGHDYPYGYVRWTENRNMSAFVRLLENKAVQIEPLITHVFDIDQAENAYDLVTGKVKEHSIGILLKYPENERRKVEKTRQKSVQSIDEIGIGFIGAGSFAQKFLIPYAKNFGSLISVVTSRGITAKSVGEKFNFKSYSTDANDIFFNREINTVFIATRHNTHANLTLEAIKAKKNVFVEKPLALSRDDMEVIASTYKQSNNLRLMVGFNRRFAPQSQHAKELFKDYSEPLVINYRINAGFIPKEHWVHTEEGGGRIIGEVCHFVDFIQYITGANPIKVCAESISNKNLNMPNNDNVLITIRFDNGSIGNISYISCGDKLLNKERIEIFGGGTSMIINDFRDGEYYSNGKLKKFKMPGKGHREEIELFLKSIRNGLSSPIPLDSILYTTETTFCILDSLITGLPQSINIP